MRAIVILIALSVIGKSYEKVEIYEEDLTQLEEMLCINVALETYLEDYRNVRVFLTNTSSFRNFITNVFPLFVITRWDLLRERFSPAAEAIIIFLGGNYEQDFNGFDILQEETVQVMPVLFVCITDIICSSEKYMNKIVEISFGTEFRYITIDESGTINIYEYTTTIKGSCGIGQLFKYGSCSDKLKARKAFRTWINFNGCPLRVVTWFSPPYSESCNNRDQLNSLCGISGDAVKMLIGKLNATPVVNKFESAEDVRLTIANKSADLGYGALDDRQHPGVTYSAPYMFVQATIVAPHSIWAIENSSGNVLQPFGNEVWMGIGTVIVLILILGRVVPYFHPIYPDQLFGIFLGIPVSRQPKVLPNRIYFLSLVLFGYFCSQAYLTNLTKVLASPRQKMIRTLNDIENSGIQVSGPSAGRDRFKGYYPRIYRDFRVDDQSVYYRNLYQLLRGRTKAAYYVEDLDKNIASWKNVEAVNERFNWYSVVLAAPNTSNVFKFSNKILLILWESGVLRVHHTFASVLYPAPEFKGIVLSEQTEVLNYDDLKGVFLLLIVGLALSSFVFIMEVVVVFFNKREPELKEQNETLSDWSRDNKQGFRLMRPRQTYRFRIY